MKDAVKRTINRVKLYFRRREALRNMADNYIEANAPNMTFPEQVTFHPGTTLVPGGQVIVPQPITTEPDPVLEKSVQELVFAIDQEAAAAPVTPTQDPRMVAINRRVGVN